ncbi:MAG: hypothetical protein MZV64_49335 [Ignavibacteriales bacterium]|nr:hypothetical protein [Ignavibacteriales bacterium]
METATRNSWASPMTATPTRNRLTRTSIRLKPRSALRLFSCQELFLLA